MYEFPADVPSETLEELLLAIGALLMRRQTETLAGLEQPLTFRQYRILARVGDEGSISLTELARQANRSMPTITESVSALVERGLVSRNGTHDRRSVALSLTSAGRSGLDDARRALTTFAAELTSGLPKHSRPELECALTSICERLDTAAQIPSHSQTE